LGPTTVKLTWVDKSALEGGYRIERESGAGEWTLVALTKANAQSYVDTGAIRNRTNVYRVRAIRGSDSSTFSNDASAATPP
jgi:hypothetical protein